MGRNQSGNDYHSQNDVHGGLPKKRRHAENGLEETEIPKAKKEKRYDSEIVDLNDSMVEVAGQPRQHQ